MGVFASWLLPLDIGLVMGLMFVWPVLALTASFRLLNFPDLTLEGSFPTGAAVFSVAVLHGWSIPSALAGAMAAGACLGAATAAIHGWLHVNKFLAGILVVAMSYTIDLRVMDASNIGLFGYPSVFDAVQPLNDLASNLQLGNISLLVLILGIGTLLLLAAASTPWGLRLRVSGSNPNYARELGLNSTAYVIVGLAVTNALVAGSAAMIAMYQGFADVGMGQGGLVLALACMTIGERLVPQRRLSIPAFVIFSAIAGALVYQIVTAYALRLGLAATDLKLATAVFVLIVIAIRVRQRDDSFLEVSG